VHYHARDMAWCAAISRASRWCCHRPRRRSRRGQCAARTLSAPFPARALRRPATAIVEAIDLRRERPPPGRFHLAAACGRGAHSDRARRAGAAVSQSPRLCAADAVPRLPASASPVPTATPGWSITASASSWFATIAASPCRILPRARNAGGKIPSSPAAGVERLEEEVRALFPQARCWCCPAIWSPRSSACARSSPTSPPAAFDIVIGTQLVAKGHHFRCSTWSASSTPTSGSATATRAPPSEPSSSASGHRPRRPRSRRRAGTSADASARPPGDARADRAGPAAFYDAEIEARERTHYPPFGRLASLIVSGTDKSATQSFARSLPARADATTFACSPAEAPLALMRGRHRLRLLVKAPRNFDLSAYLREWLNAAPRRRARSS